MIRVFTYSEPGGHTENEDAFAVRPHPHDRELHVCVVADGQGGRAGGAIAAKIASEVCVETASSFPLVQLLRPGTWTEILRTVDEAVCDNPNAGFTTVVAFCVTHRFVCGASSGDSAAVLLSVDKPGEVLTAQQYKNPPVGSRAATFVPFGAKLVCPWTMLAMSDGVWKYTGWENILKITPEKPGEEIVECLRERARLRVSGSFQDDFTLIVLSGSAS